MFFATGSTKILSAQNADVSVDYQTSPLNPVNPETRTLLNLISIKRSRHGDLFASITYNSLYLWSCRVSTVDAFMKILIFLRQPDVMIGKITRSQVTVEEDGENVEILWKPDSTAIVVTTNKGYLHFYDILNGEGKLFDFKFINPHHYVIGAGEKGGCPNKSLRFKMAIQIDTGIASAIGLSDEILICTSESPSLLSLCWNGEVNASGTCSLADVSFLTNPADPFVHMTTNKFLDLFCWTSKFRNCYLAQRKLVQKLDNNGDANAPQELNCVWVWSGLCFFNSAKTKNNAVTCAINSKLLKLAVGTHDGDILLFSLSEDKTSLSYMHTLSLSQPPGLSNVFHVGPVSCLEFSSDGNAIAVGWHFGGLSLWSVAGRLLFSTMSEDTIAESPTERPTISQEDYFNGVAHLFFGPGSYDLFILPSQSYSNDVVNDIYVIPFAKSALTMSKNSDNTRCICLVSDDKLLLHEANIGDSFGYLDSNLVLWDSIQIPVMYLGENWPIRHCSVNSTGHFAAIAGKRGLAHYSAKTNKWKLFGNEHQEQTFFVTGGILWFKNILIFACQDLETYNHEIRFFSRDNNLDNNLALHVEKMPRVVVTMNILANNILVYTADNVLRYYVIKFQDQKMKLLLQQQLSLTNMVTLPQYVNSVCWFPPPSPKINSKVLKKSPILFLRNGILSLIIEKEKGEWEHIILSDRIEFFWLSNNEERISDLYNSLWAFDGFGVKIWTNLIVSDEVLNSRFQWICSDTYAESIYMNLNFYPLTVKILKGILLGIEQRISLRSPLQCALFKMESKTHLFIQYFLRFLLSNGMQQEASGFANKYQSLDYFSHSLELLLHQVLEEESDTQKLNLLPVVTEFIQTNFTKNYFDIIIRCARKNEPSIWNFFFSCVGDIKLIFRQCLDLGLLNTATSSLKIIQILETESVSGKFATELLDKALYMEEFEISREVIRYLSTIEDRLPYTDLIQKETNFEKSDSATPIDVVSKPAINTTFYLEVLISNHARKMVERDRWRALGIFSNSLSFPIVPWLRNESPKVSLPWSTILSKLHLQFNLPLQNDYTVIYNCMKQALTPSGFAIKRRETVSFISPRESEVNRRTNNNNSGLKIVIDQSSRKPFKSKSFATFESDTDSSFSNTLESNSYFKSNVKSLLEIRQLFKYMEESGLIEMGIIFGIMIMEIEWICCKLHDDTSETKSLMKKFVEVTKNSECQAYRQLHNLVINIIAEGQ